MFSMLMIYSKIKLENDSKEEGKGYFALTMERKIVICSKFVNS